jgi:two-component system, OmpR family, KDP operon response regulator KdpE
MSASLATTEILLVDDEVQTRRLLRFTLEDSGYAVREAETGRRGLSEFAYQQPDIVILDLGLPDLSGLDVLRRIREWSEAPVLVLSVFGQEDSKVTALDAGADDYLTKPFTEGELLARLRALRRRARLMEDNTVLRFGNVEVDLTQRRVLKNGALLRLTDKEYALLRLLLTNRDKVLTHAQLLKELWGPEAIGKTHYLRVFMMRLRKKVEDEPDAPHYLQTESTIGYRLVSNS